MLAEFARHSIPRLVGWASGDQPWVVRVRRAEQLQDADPGASCSPQGGNGLPTVQHEDEGLEANSSALQPKVEPGKGLEWCVDAPGRRELFPMRSERRQPFALPAKGRAGKRPGMVCRRPRPPRAFPNAERAPRTRHDSVRFRPSPPIGLPGTAASVARGDPGFLSTPPTRARRRAF